MCQTSIVGFLKRRGGDDDPGCADAPAKVFRCLPKSIHRDRDFGRREGAVMDSMYSIPKASLAPEELEEHLAALTMQPVEFSNFGKKDSSFQAFEITDTALRVPRFYGTQNFGDPCTVATTSGSPMDVPFSGTLNPGQERAADACVTTLGDVGGGMLVLPCGYGKTIVALYIAHRMRMRTLVLVHKTFLVEQWRERVAAFLPGASVGKIQANVVDANVDVCIAMVHSMASRNYDPGVLDTFGLLIVDEAHHMSAPYFSTALRKLRCARILALSATPERKDGLTHLLFWSMGPIAHRIERRPEALDVYVVNYNGGQRREIRTRDGLICMPKMVNDMVDDCDRNMLIARAIAKLHERDRRIIVLSDRVGHLCKLHGLFVELVGEDAREAAAFYIGKTSAEDRETASHRSPIFSTYAMAKEGLDIPTLDTLVFATPKGDVEQSIGRIQRPCAAKQVPLVVDIADHWSVFRNLRFKRCAHYNTMKYAVTVVDDTDFEVCLDPTAASIFSVAKKK